MRNYTFRPLTEDDLPLMRRWLDTAHVKVWWPDAEKKITLMERDMNAPNINMMVVSLINHPYAYLHDHDAKTFGMPQYADLPHGARVMATFVGDSDFMGQGHSVGYIDAHVRAFEVELALAASLGFGDGENLLRYHTQHFDVDAVELVEAAPGAAATATGAAALTPHLSSRSFTRPATSSTD